MTSHETDTAVADGRRVLARVQGRDQLPVAARGAIVPTTGRSLARRAAAIAGVNVAIIAAAFFVSLFAPLGLFGGLAMITVMIAATLAIAFMPATPRAPRYERLREGEVRALPAQTARWLQAQRPALPAPAQLLADQIGAKLDTLSPQLAALDNGAPAASEVRKLVGEQLPDFVRGYTQVPANLRGVPRNGKTPDQQLTDGLKVIDRELADMSASLAQGDLDSLETRSRFLEIKYQGDGATG